EGDLALAAPDGVLVEHRCRLVPVLRPEMAHALLFEAEIAPGRGHRIALFIAGSSLARPSPQSTPPLDRAVAQRGDCVKVPSTGARYWRAMSASWTRAARAASGVSTGDATGAVKSSRAVSPSHRRSIPSGSMPVIRHPAPLR